MSRFRCGNCSYIMDSQTWNEDYCPKCRSEKLDEKWTQLDHAECERLYREQRKKERKRNREVWKLYRKKVRGK